MHKSIVKKICMLYCTRTQCLFYCILLLFELLSHHIIFFGRLYLFLPFYWIAGDTPPFGNTATKDQTCLTTQPGADPSWRMTEKAPFVSLFTFSKCHWPTVWRGPSNRTHPSSFSWHRVINTNPTSTFDCSLNELLNRFIIFLWMNWLITNLCSISQPTGQVCFITPTIYLSQ